MWNRSSHLGFYWYRSITSHFSDLVDSFFSFFLQTFTHFLNSTLYSEVTTNAPPSISYVQYV